MTRIFLDKFECKACALYAYEPPDMEAFRPPALMHTCRKLGPKTKKQILAQIAKLAKEVYREPRWPGGWYHAEEELACLLWRLAND